MWKKETTTKGHHKPCRHDEGGGFMVYGWPLLHNSSKVYYTFPTWLDRRTQNNFGVEI